MKNILPAFVAATMLSYPSSALAENLTITEADGSTWSTIVTTPECINAALMELGAQPSNITSFVNVNFVASQRTYGTVFSPTFTTFEVNHAPYAKGSDQVILHNFTIEEDTFSSPATVGMAFAPITLGSLFGNTSAEVIQNGEIAFAEPGRVDGNLKIMAIQFSNYIRSCNNELNLS